MAVHFLADLHISGPKGPFARRLIEYLDHAAPQAEAVYVLGDLFDIWIGDDDGLPRYQAVIQAFGRLSQKGIPLYFIVGNRDYAVGPEFAKQTGFSILPDPTAIRLYGQTVLLSHGDLFCTDDIAHQKYRAKYTNPKWVKHRLWLPLWFRRAVADRARKNSQRRKETRPREIMDVTTKAVNEYMQNYQASILIHGHTHRPDRHQLTVNHQPATRIVLPDWRPNHCGLLVASEQGFTTQWLD